MDEKSFRLDRKKIYDLTDIYEEKNGRNNQEIILVDGRGYEKINKENKHIHELVDVAEDQSSANMLQEEMIEQIIKIAEKIAREIVPEVAERVIREEIDKLKKISKNASTTVN